LRRIVPAIVAAALALIGLVLFLGARDDAEVAPAKGPGELRADRGAAHNGPARPEGDEPPTSGTHRPELVSRDRRELTDDQLIHALELGNVVIVSERIGPELAAVQREVAGPFDAEIAAAGQAVILARGDGPTTALAWRRLLRSDDPAELQAFAEAWLASGAPQRGQR
jgi:Protein of unknown function (DUF3105)